jgi:hypothetical protein
MLNIQECYKTLRVLTRGVNLTHDQHDAVEQCLEYLYIKARDAEEKTNGSAGDSNDPGRPGLEGS